MLPNVVSNEPDNCPIFGMALEAKDLNPDDFDDTGIAISSAMSNSTAEQVSELSGSDLDNV